MRISWRNAGKAEPRGRGSGSLGRRDAALEGNSALENDQKGNAGTIIQMVGSQLSPSLEEMKRQWNLQLACLC